MPTPGGALAKVLFWKSPPLYGGSLFSLYINRIKKDSPQMTTIYLIYCMYSPLQFLHNEYLKPDK